MCILLDMAMPNEKVDPTKLVRPRRHITGMSATLLPFDHLGKVDWDNFCRHVSRTAQAGLIPAVNMDTGYVNLIDEETRQEVLTRTREVLGRSDFIAGAFVEDRPRDSFNLLAYHRQIDLIQSHGGTPVLFQSYGLISQQPDVIVRSYEQISRFCNRFIAFELGTMFAPFGKIYDLDVFKGILKIPQCIGMKHSSLDRDLELERLAIRNEQRPDFKIFTGNDLAIDMVKHGSDYLLGLGTFAPDLFARRDKMWESGDPGFYELNDQLQSLGTFAFRNPVPAYKHSAAQFLKLRGWINCDEPHPNSMRRPESDLQTLRDIGKRLDIIT